MNSHLLKIAVGCVVCFILSLTTVIPTHSADIKLGKVNMESVINNSKRLKAATEEVRKIQTEGSSKLAGMRTQINQLEERLKNEKSSLKQDEKEKLENEVQRKIEEMTNEQQSLQAKLNFRERSIQNVFRTQVRAAVEKIAKEQGLTAVLSEQAMIFSGNLPDLTDKVITEFDAMPAIEKQSQQ